MLIDGRQLRCLGCFNQKVEEWKIYGSEDSSALGGVVEVRISPLVDINHHLVGRQIPSKRTVRTLVEDLVS